MTCEDTRSTTSSPASEAGRSLLEWLAGLTPALFGRAPAPASPSAPPARAKVQPTTGTYGRIGFVSSASAALQRSLESRLRRRLDGAGSTLFTLTWKTK